MVFRSSAGIVAALCLAAISAPGRVAAEDGEAPQGVTAGDPLAPLRFLVGACWQGTFPDGRNVDTHCYEGFYGNAFIRDTHRVRGENPDYRGLAIYHYDPESKAIVYRYWNSLGGVSDGRILSPRERHVTEDGRVIELRTVIEQTAPDTYVSVSEQRNGEAWREIWRIGFSRLTPAGAQGEPGPGMPPSCGWD